MTMQGKTMLRSQRTIVQMAHQAWPSVYPHSSKTMNSLADPPCFLQYNHVPSSETNLHPCDSTSGYHEFALVITNISGPMLGD